MDAGFGRFPSRVVATDAAWLQLALTGIDLLAWTRMLILHGDLATAEPKKLRHRLLHVAARLTHGDRRVRLRIAEPCVDCASDSSYRQYVCVVHGWCIVGSSSTVPRTRDFLLTHFGESVHAYSPQPDPRYRLQLPSVVRDLRPSLHRGPAGVPVAAHLPRTAPVADTCPTRPVTVAPEGPDLDYLDRAGRYK